MCFLYITIFNLRFIKVHLLLSLLQIQLVILTIIDYYIMNKYLGMTLPGGTKELDPITQPLYKTDPSPIIHLNSTVTSSSIIQEVKLHPF